MKQILLAVIFMPILLPTAFGQAQRTPEVPTSNNPLAATSRQAELLSTITRLDSKLFDAFNSRNLEAMKKIFADDVEFYQDNQGVSDYNGVIDSLKNLFEQSKSNGMRRELVKGSLEVYPIKGYGAIQVGQHRFCHMEQGREDCGTFKFVHIWRQKEREWKITRVVSYGH
jgi:ketosteroid isomerase-like protein